MLKMVPTLEGKRVLVHGGSGGIGSFAVQVCGFACFERCNLHLTLRVLRSSKRRAVHLHGSGATHTACVAEGFGARVHAELRQCWHSAGNKV